MTVFSTKLNTIANNTNSYLKSFFLKQKNNSYLLKPMKYGVFSGGKTKENCSSVCIFSSWEARSIVVLLNFTLCDFPKTRKRVVVLCKNEGGHFPGLMLWAAAESFCVFCIMQ